MFKGLLILDFCTLYAGLDLTTFWILFCILILISAFKPFCAVCKIMYMNYTLYNKAHLEMKLKARFLIFSEL